MESTSDDILDASQFSYEGDFETQVNEILQAVRLTRDAVVSLQCLLDDLEGVLQAVWPGCQVHPFGSIVTGLGIRTSDIDCYVALPHSVTISKKPPVILARNELKKYPMKFCELFAITSAKVPILKFFHKPTHFHCDVNVSSLSGVRNSKLISYLLTRDPRLLSLAILIKYWSKVHNFTGTNLMPNYALTIMVIFYLQTKNMLPSIAELQDQEDFLVDNWNTAFNDIHYYNTCDESLYELLGGFFKFYTTFDFKEFIISPYLGHSIKRKLFEDINSIPSEFGLYKENVSRNISKTLRLDAIMCIQDPFEHNRNCSVAMYAKLVDKVMRHFTFAARMYEEKSKDSFLQAVLTEDPLVAKVVQNMRHNVRNKIEKNKPKRFKQRMKNNISRWFEETRKFYKRKG